MLPTGRTMYSLDPSAIPTQVDVEVSEDDVRFFWKILSMTMTVNVLKVLFSPRGVLIL